MRPLLVASVVVLACALPAAAHAADVDACLSASDVGQSARSEGKLREARKQFLVCGGERCPPIVRRDCVQWAAEVAQEIPSVVFGAKDGEGNDLFDVSVSMDGEPLVIELDGKAVFVDPGPHTFRFDAAGKTSVTEKVLIKEGEKSRVLAATFRKEAPDRPPEPSVASTDDATAGGHGALPWIVVGIGAAGVATGIAILATSPERPASCDADTKTCTRLPGQSLEDFEADQQKAGDADAQPVIGWAITGIGAAFVAGGLLWHFLEPTGDPKRSARLAPWTTTGGGGLSAFGSF